MKKFVVLLLLLGVAACVEAGAFSEKRNRLHQLGQEEDYCQRNPDRCVDGVAW